MECKKLAASAFEDKVAFRSAADLLGQGDRHWPRRSSHVLGKSLGLHVLGKDVIRAGFVGQIAAPIGETDGQVNVARGRPAIARPGWSQSNIVRCVYRIQLSSRCTNF